MKHATLWVVLITLIALSPPHPLASANTRTHDITLDDYFTLGYLTALATSPDGTRVAYVESRWNKEEDNRNSDLWVVEIKNRSVTRLTFDPAADTSPQWSPDGRYIYFSSSRGDKDGKPPHNDKTQVWRVSPEGGPITAVTRLPKGIAAFELSRDGNSLYFTAPKEEIDDDAWKPLRKEFDKLQYGHGVESYHELWRLDLQSWHSRKLVDENRHIVSFSVSGDEQYVAMVTRPDEHLLSNEGWSHVDVYDTSSQEILRLPDQKWRDDAPSPFGWIEPPSWSAVAPALAFTVEFDGYPAEIFVARLTDEGPQITMAERPREATVRGPLRWKPDTGDLCFIAEEQAHRRVVALPDIASGSSSGDDTLTPGNVVVDDYSFAADTGTLVTTQAGLDFFVDLVLIENPGPNASSDRLTNINPHTDTWKLPQVKVVRWTSKDGTPVEGILELPPDYDPKDGPLPMVVTIHGGPTAMTANALRYWIYGGTAFAAKGWARLDPNYRGSTGYGDQFLTDLIGNKNNLDVQDILAGVDAMVEQGIADPEKLGVMGWSNGGYLTNCLIAATPRFKAASSGAGVFDTVMQWSTEDTPGHVINFSKGLPWEDAGTTMHRTSPLYDIDSCETPTLIHVGENDPRVPQEHSRALYRSLRHYLNVPTELIIYPEAGHGLTKYSHRKAKLDWDHQWFDQYVLGIEHENPDD
ncbi:MAG: S9 family peptidase [Verrucomicrobiota bacterium]